MKSFRVSAIAALVAAIVMTTPPRGTGEPVSPTPPGFSGMLLESGFEVLKRDLGSTDFSLESLAGKQLALSSLKGKLVLLNFWATWCGPCNIELPSIKALYGKLKSRGLEIVAVDLMEDRKTVSDFVKAKGVPFIVLLDTDGRVGGLYGTEGIPTTFIIDRSGKILARKVGIGGPAWDSPEIVGLLEKLLAAR